MTASFPKDPSVSPAPTPRDRLALVRTQLANERTLLAYGRTALVFAGSGVGLLKFFGDGPLALALGWALVALAVVTAAVGVSRFRHVASRLPE